MNLTGTSKTLHTDGGQMQIHKIKLSTILIIALSLVGIANISCYSWYESKIDMDSKTPKISLGDFLYNEPEITSLTVPNQLIVSKGVYSGTIKLHWDEVPYATSYRIERAVVEPDLDGKTYTLPEEGDFEVINKYVYTNNYSDLILASPADSNKEYQNKYFYRISAENIKMGLESSEFTQVSNDNSGWLLTPPAVIEAAKGEDQDFIEINWSAVPNAFKYMIYRSEKSNGLGMELLDTVTGNITSYKNLVSSSEKGQEFYYKVCAVLDNGSQSAFTGLAMGYSAKEGAPSAPAGLTVTNAKAQSLHSLSLSWASAGTGEITYSLYRTSSEETVYTLVCSNLTGTTFEDKSALKPGLKYYYYVQAIETKNDEKLKSPFSKTGPGTPAEAVGWLLSPPSNCEVEDSKDSGKINLRWTPSVGYESVEYLYNIYTSETLTGEYTLLPDCEKISASSLTLGNDGYYSLSVTKKPFYKISAFNNLNEAMESDQSYAVAPCPAAPQSVTATKTASLGGITNFTPNTNGVYPVQITWSAPAGEAPYGYYVYRSTKPDSSFRKITDSPITDNSFVFIDTNETARPGTFYYYKVVSLNILMQGKNSNTQNADTRGYGALTRDQWFREYNKTVKKSLSKLTLMHKSGDTDKLGSETINGEISGSLSYNAKLDGFSGRVLMHYTNYADFNIKPDESLGVYFLLNGDTNTSASASKNGSMDGTNVASTMGMYPGYAKYDNIAIKGGAAGGGYYVVCTQDKNGNTVLGEGNVDWTVGEE